MLKEEGCQKRRDIKRGGMGSECQKRRDGECMSKDEGWGVYVWK